MNSNENKDRVSKEQQLKQIEGRIACSCYCSYIKTTTPPRPEKHTTTSMQIGYSLRLVVLFFRLLPMQGPSFSRTIAAVQRNSIENWKVTNLCNIYASVRPVCPTYICTYAKGIAGIYTYIFWYIPVCLSVCSSQVSSWTLSGHIAVWLQKCNWMAVGMCDVVKKNSETAKT